VPIYKKGEKTIVSWDITAISFIQNCIKYTSLKAKTICIDEIVVHPQCGL
jgi:hypothetical protein